MGLQVLLILDQGTIFAGNCKLSKDFFFDLKEAGFIQRASSFEELPDEIFVDFVVEDCELCQDHVVVDIFSTCPIPSHWGRTDKYLNRDLIGRWDDQEVIECSFQLGIEYVSIVEKGVSIMIDIPIGLRDPAFLAGFLLSFK